MDMRVDNVVNVATVTNVPGLTAAVVNSSENIGASISFNLPLVTVVSPAQNINLVTVSGPRGPQGVAGPAGTGLANLTGIYPIFYDAGSGVVGIVSDYYVTFPNLTSASGALVAQINAFSGGVNSLNGLSGILGLTGAGNVSVSINGQTLIISGLNSGEVSQAQLNSLSGYVNSQDQATGYAATLYASGASGALQGQINALPTSAQLAQTGSTLYNLATGLSGQNVIDYATKTQLTQSGTTLYQRDSDISGVLQSQITLIGTNPSGYITSGQTGLFYAASNPQQYATSGDLASTGLYLYSLITGNTGVNPGFITTGQADLRYYPLATNPSGYITSGQTGQFYPASNPQAYATSGNLAATGEVLYALVTGLSGQGVLNYATQTQLTQTGVTLGGQINSLSGFVGLVSGGLEIRIAATGNASVAHANSIGNTLSGNLTATGQALYGLITGSSGQAILDYATKTQLTQTGVSLGASVIASGNAAVAHANGIGVNLSGNLTTTGQILYQTVTGLSGQANLNYATITNLGATGQTLYALTTNISGILNAQIASTGQQSWTAANNNGINLSGNLTQTGITLFDQTTGLSGFMISLINASNAGVLAINGVSGVVTIQGTGSISTFTLGNTVIISGDADPTFYATVPFVTGISGVLSTRITATGEGAINYANGIGVNLSGNLTQTGSVLDGKINSLSGFVTNSYITTGQTGQFYPASNPQYYATSGDVVATGNATIAFANGMGTILSGNLTQTGSVLDAKINALSGFVGLVSGGLETRIAQTGQSAFLALVATSGVLQSQINSLPTSAALQSTGQQLYVLVTGMSGQSVIDYATKTQLTQSGVTLGAKIDSLSGYAATQDYSTGRAAILYASGASGALQTQINTLPTTAYVNGMGTNLSGNLTLTGQTLQGRINSLSGFVGNVSGGLETRIFATGAAAIAYTDSRVAATGQAAWTAAQNNAINLSGSLTQTGVIIEGQIGSLSGWTVTNLGATGSRLYTLMTGMSGQSTLDFATKVSLASTGQQLYTLITGASGQAVLDYATKSQLTQTGVTLGAAIIASGNAAVTHSNGIGINLSGNLQSTGSNLQAQINAIVAVTGYTPPDILYTSGTQYVSGVKYFIGNTYIDNLYVTGTQTVIHTEDVYVSDNWLVLNATGNARDSAIFISTGFTGVSATGAVIGWDVPTNSWRFGLASQLTDLMTLPTIASGEAVTTLASQLGQTGATLYSIINEFSGQTSLDYATKVQLTNTGVALGGQISSLSGFVGLVSGGLEARITQTGNASVTYANGVGTNLSGNLTLTGQTLFARDTSISGGLEVRITATGNAAIAHANGIGSIISGNLTATGATLFARDASISGGLEVRIFATGNAAVVYANGIGTNLSGNLTLTGQTLQGRITSLSGFVGNVSGGLEARITQTGNAAIAHANGMGSIISGNLTQTGITLWNRDASISGGLEQRIFLTGAAAVLYASGASGVLQGKINSLATTTQLYQTGANLYNLITAASGQANVNYAPALANYVYRSGTQSITGQKTFVTRVIVGSATDNTSAPLVVEDGGARWGAALLRSPLNPALLLYDTSVTQLTTGALLYHGATNEMAFGYITGASISSVTKISTLSGWMVVGPIGTPPQQSIHAIAGIRAESGFWSGITNLADIFASKTELTSTGSVLYGDIVGLSGVLNGIFTNQNLVYQTGQQSISGIKFFVSGDYETQKTLTANYSITPNDSRLYCNNTNPMTLTFGSAITNSGQLVKMKIINTGSVYLTGTAGQTFDGSPLYVAMGQYNTYEIHSNGANWYIW